MLTDEELRNLAIKWAAMFSSSSSEGFAAMYASNGSYQDHAFQIIRTGRDMIRRHHEVWLKSVPDFVMTIYHFDSRPHGISIRYVGRGTFVNDLPSMKATGEAFEFRGVVDLAFDDSGLIEKTDEFYSTSFGRGVPLENYHTLP